MGLRRAPGKIVHHCGLLRLLNLRDAVLKLLLVGISCFIKELLPP